MARQWQSIGGAGVSETGSRQWTSSDGTGVSEVSGGGGTVYNQSCAATNGSSAGASKLGQYVRSFSLSDTTAFVFSRLLSAGHTQTASTAVSAPKVVSAGSTYAVTEAFTPSMTKSPAYTRAAASSVGLVAALLRGAAYQRAEAATAAVSAGMSQLTTFLRSLAPTSGSAVTFVHGGSYLRSLAHTGGAAPAMQRALSLFKAATAASAASALRGYFQALSATGGSTARMVQAIPQSLAVTAATTAVLAKARLLIAAVTATATSTPALVRSTAKILLIPVTPVIQILRQAEVALRAVTGVLARGNLETAVYGAITESTLARHGLTYYRDFVASVENYVSRVLQIAKRLGVRNAYRVYAEILSPQALLGGTNLVAKFAKTSAIAAYHALINRIQAKF